MVDPPGWETVSHRVVRHLAFSEANYSGAIQADPDVPRPVFGKRHGHSARVESCKAVCSPVPSRQLGCTIPNTHPDVAPTILVQAIGCRAGQTISTRID